jgi:hypothetical protein
MRERWTSFLMTAWQRDPRLNPKEGAAVSHLSGRALGVCNATAGRHPVDLAGLDYLYGAEAIAVQEFPFEKVRDSR